MNNSADTSAKNSMVGLNIKRVFCYIILILLAFISILPFYLLFVYSSRSHEQIMSHFSFIPGKYFFKNIHAALFEQNKNTLPVLLGFRNTFIISVSATVLSVYFSALTAYAVHVYNFKIKKIAYTFILLIMMVPLQVFTLGFYNLMVSWELNDTFWPLIIPAVAAPATVFFMKQYMESAVPLDLVEASRIDGSGEFGTYNRIIMPILKPAFAVQAIFAFVMNWNNFFLPQLIIDSTEKKTLSMLIYQLRSSSFEDNDFGVNYALIFVCIIPVIIMYLLLSKFIIRGITLGSVKG